jgi:hypothetical protein
MDRIVRPEGGLDREGKRHDNMSDDRDHDVCGHVVGAVMV